MSTLTDKKYPEGFDMSNFEHLSEISVYNHNYFKNGADLLFEKSDDDHTSEWYLVLGDRVEYLGATFFDERDKYLHKIECC